MKLAISNIAWDRSEDQAIAQLMQQYGVTGLDVAPGKLGDDPMALSDAEINAYVDFWRGYGVQIVGMQSLLYGHSELRIFGDADTRQKTSDYLKRVIDLAAKLGVGPMVFGSPKNRQRGDLPLSEAQTIAADFFAELAECAHEHSTTLCLEPNPVQYGADFINTTAEALELVQQVNHSGFRLHLDSAIMTMNGENIENALNDAINWLAHFHISEPQLGLVTKDGKVDQERFIGQLHGLAYDGWFSIEMRGGHTSPDSSGIGTSFECISSTLPKS